MCRPLASAPDAPWHSHWRALALLCTGGRDEVLEPLLKAGSTGLEELRMCPSPGKLRTMSQVQGRPEEQLATGGLTPLALAAMADQPSCVKELLRLGARLDASCPCLGFTPVQHAVHAGSLATLRVLLDAGANLSVRDAKKHTLLDVAALHPGPGCSTSAGACPHAACLRELFKRGCCLGLLDDRDAAGDTALATACRHGHAAVVELLLGQGVDPNAGQEPPLTLACMAGCLRAVELLIDRDVRCVIRRGLPSPLMAALQPDRGEEGEFVPATEQRLACARLLLERHVASPDELSGPTASRPVLQLTPLLQMATFSVCVDAAKVLLDAGAAVDGLGSGPSVQLGSPLVVAVKAGNVGVARALLDGASLQKLGPLGATVLHGAMSAGPAALRLVLWAMQERLTREQRRQLFLAQTPAGAIPLHVSTRAGGDQNETLQLLIAAMQLEGLQVADSTGQLVAGAGGGTSVAEPSAAAAAAGDSKSAGAGSSKKKKAKSRVGPALSQYSISENAAGTVQAGLADGRQAQMLLLGGDGTSAASAAIQAMYDAIIAANPDAMHDIRDPAWRSLPPAAQLAEGRRILALLHPSSDVRAQTSALSFLQVAVGGGSLRQLLLKAGLANALIDLLDPKQAAARPLSWHLPLSSMLSHLFCVEPGVARRVWASAPLGGHILEFLRAEMLAGRGQEVPGGDRQQVTIGYLSLWSSGTGDVDHALWGWERASDDARLLVVQTVALLARLPDLRKMAVTLIMPLNAVWAAGVRDSLEDPALDFLNRSVEARRLFLGSPLLLTLADLLKACDTDGHRWMLLKQLGYLAGSCSSQLVQHGVPRFCLDLLSGEAHTAQQAVQQPSSETLVQAAICLLLLANYGSRLTCERLWQAGMLAVTVRQLDALMAAAERGPPALAAALPLAWVLNELLKGVLHVLCKAEAARYLPEVRSLRLPAKALHLLGSVADMLASGSGRDDAELWVSLQRQLSTTASVLVTITGAELVPSLLEGGILSSIATLFPKAHFTAAANLLSLYNLAVTLGGPAALEELRRERVDRVLGLQGAYDPAWLAAQPLTPLQQLIRQVMRAVNTSAGDAKFVMIAKGMLRATKAALLGSPLGLDSSAYMAQYRVEAPFSEEAEGPRCACCGALGGAAGINLSMCSGCKANSFCGPACQLRNWKLERKAVCSSRRKAASSG